jgi:hypothetical protein
LPHTCWARCPYGFKITLANITVGRFSSYQTSRDHPGQPFPYRKSKPRGRVSSPAGAGGGTVAWSRCSSKQAPRKVYKPRCRDPTSYITLTACRIRWRKSTIALQPVSLLPGAVERVKHSSELPRGPTHPQLGDQTMAKSINHGQQAVSIRCDDLRHDQVTPRAKRWGANCRSPLSALETDSAEGAWEVRCRHR